MAVEISVIIPTCGSNNFIYETFLSLENQMLSHNSFEIIVVANGVSDFFLEELNFFFLRSKIINYKIISTITLGVSNARNLGIENSIGDYICFVDDDDIISSDYLSGLYNAIGENSIVISNVKCFLTDLTILSDDYLSLAFNIRKDEINFKGLKIRKFLSSSCCKLIKKSVISDTRFINSIKLNEDSLFMFQISKNIKSLKCSEDNAIYYRRLRPNSASRQKINIFYIINDFLTFSYLLSKIYFKSPFKYNFSIYLGHLIANLNTTLKKVLTNFN